MAKAGLRADRGRAGPLLGRLVRIRKTHGWSLPRRMLGKILSRGITLRTLLLFKYPLPILHGNKAIAASGCVISTIGAADAPLFVALCDRFPAHDFPERLQSGRQCHVACIEERIAGFAWVAHDELWIEEIEFRYLLNRDEIFIYDCFVSDDCRGRGIYPALIEAIVHHADKGLENPMAIFIASMTSNTASIRGIAKTKFRECLRIRYLKCGRLRKWWKLAVRSPASQPTT